MVRHGHILQYSYQARERQLVVDLALERQILGEAHLLGFGCRACAAEITFPHRLLLPGNQRFHMGGPVQVVALDKNKGGPIGELHVGLQHVQPRKQGGVRPDLVRLQRILFSFRPRALQEVGGQVVLSALRLDFLATLLEQREALLALAQQRKELGLQLLCQI